jgi:hypothetical protein
MTVSALILDQPRFPSAGPVADALTNLMPSSRARVAGCRDPVVVGRRGNAIAANRRLDPGSDPGEVVNTFYFCWYAAAEFGGHEGNYQGE